VRIGPLALTLLVLVPGAAAAQTSAKPKADITGTWQAKVKEKTKDGSRTVTKEVVIRGDSSASYEKETVRWRWPAPGAIWLALGGEWEKFKIDLKGDKLTLSEGDLQEPITLKRIGPPTARAANVPVPPDPDTEQ
jgi:hypothetical protein